jgi:hypothetical protein
MQPREWSDVADASGATRKADAQQSTLTGCARASCCSERFGKVEGVAPHICFNDAQACCTMYVADGSGGSRHGMKHSTCCFSRHSLRCAMLDQIFSNLVFFSQNDFHNRMSP